MWRAQLLLALLAALVAASGRSAAQPGGGGGIAGALGSQGAAGAPGPLPAPAPAAGNGADDSGSPGSRWLQVQGSGGTRATDVQALALLKAAVENWDAYYAANSFKGWDTSTPVCNWSGVTCADDGTILTLSWQCRSCRVRAVGTLPPGLGRISTLATLDLQSNQFYGPLPPQWGEVDSWTQLQNLYINDNNLTGTLPQEWGEPGALPALLQLRVDSNRLNGTLPQQWGAEETSMRQLSVLRLSSNSLTGTLPEQWGTPGAFPQLTVLSLDGNDISGTLPDIWGAPQAMSLLQELYVQGNSFRGGLPPSWGTPSTGMPRLRFLFAANNPLGGTLPAMWGANGSFPELKTLDLNATGLSGTLPPSWGSPEALPKLDAMRIEHNDLSGSIPPEWAAFESLSRLVVHPGNPRLCGPPPADLPFNLCDDRDLTCMRVRPQLAPECGPILAPPPAPAAEAAAVLGAAPASSSGSDDGGGGANVGAIVGGAVGGAVAVAAALALLALAAGRRRSRRERARQEQLRQAALKPSARPFLTEEEEEMERGLNGNGLPLSPFAAAAALPNHRQAAAGRCNSHASLPIVAGGSSRTDMSEAGTERRPSRAPSRFSSRGTLSDAGSGRRPSRFSSLLLLGSSDGSGFLSRWCSGTRTGSTELPPAGGAEAPPAGGMRVMTQIAEEGEAAPSVRGGRTPQAAAPEASTVLGQSTVASTPPSPLSLPSGDAAGVPREHLLGAAMPWSDWEIRPEEVEIAKRPDGSDWLLGSGGFGKVYKGLRHGVQPVAVKIIPARGDLQTGAAAEARQEIAILRACRDVNIVQFQGAHLGPEQTMLVTEYMEGGDLLHNIAAGRVSWYRRGKKVALDVARGLVFLHSRRIVHFDLKSANVLLARDGTAKIADVGMAKIMAHDYVSGVVGTLAWAAPEMLWGSKCSEKADIYSFGIIMWEICAGEQPERGRLRDLRVPHECPAEVRQLILECLESRPSARPSALQLVERLAAASATPPPGVAALQRSSGGPQQAGRATPPGAAGGTPPSQRPQQPPPQQQVEQQGLGQAEQQAAEEQAAQDEAARLQGPPDAPAAAAAAGAEPGPEPGTPVQRPPEQPAALSGQQQSPPDQAAAAAAGAAAAAAAPEVPATPGAAPLQPAQQSGAARATNGAIPVAGWASVLAGLLPGAAKEQASSSSRAVEPTGSGGSGAEAP